MPEAKRILAERAAQKQAAAEWLSAVFPNTFKGSGAPKLPLKIGIQADLLDATREVEGRPSRKMIRSFLTRYVSRPSYYLACRAGEVRIGLNGEPQGVVTEKEAAFAVENMKRLIVLMRSQKKADPKLLAKLEDAVLARTMKAAA